MKRVAAVIFCILLFLYNAVYASEVTPETEQKLLDVICEPADSIVYEELQAFIDEYHLPGYRVEGKKIYRYYTTFDWLGEGKNSAEAGRAYAGENYMHIIFDADQCYFVTRQVVHHYEDLTDTWRAVVDLFMGDNQIEIDGEKETVAEITCFEGVGTEGPLLYITTANHKNYVRHYDNRYVDPDTGASIAYRDYLLEDFIAYADRYAAWSCLKYPSFTPDASQVGQNPFAVYMNDGAPVSPPSGTERPNAVHNYTKDVWLAIFIPLGAVLVAGGTLAVIVRRRRNK